MTEGTQVSEWCDKGEGKQIVQVVGADDDHVYFERIAGSPEHTLYKRVKVTEDQFLAAFRRRSETELADDILALLQEAEESSASERCGERISLAKIKVERLKAELL